MKRLAKLILSLVLVGCFLTDGLAQAVADCDQLKSKITQLEQMDTNMSGSLRQIHKETLLELYSQLDDCLQRDIAAANQIEELARGTNAARSIGEKLQALNKEKAENDNKILLLREALKLGPASSAQSGPSESAPQIKRETTSGNGGEDRSAAESAPRARPETMGGNGGEDRSTTRTSRRSSTTVTPAANPAQTPCEPEAYADAPDLLTDIVAKVVGDVVRTGRPTQVGSSLSKMILYTIFDAASETSSNQVRSLTAYQYLGETARTDKQLGGSSNSDGAVSAIEKPGFARLLGFAVEHGGITKQNNGTNLTLSTSLYSLYAMKNGDTAETYDRAGILNRIGVAATFGIDNTTDELANARRNNLSEWSVKARLFGDRSTRSASYARFWDNEIRPVIRRRLLEIGGAVEGLSQHIDDFDKVARDLDACLRKAVQTRMEEADYQAAPPAERNRMLNDLVLGIMRSNVFAPVKDGRLKLDEDVIALIEGQYLPGLKSALDNLVKANKKLQEEIDNLRKGPLATFAYTNHRVPTASDYSEAKFLYEQEKGFMGPLKLTGNLGVSLYHRPDRSLNQQKLRNLFAALSFEGASDSPFTEAENLSKITYSFVGRYERLFENRRMANRTPDIGALQFVLEIPLFKGLSLPLSVTYATATEEEKKQGFRFNFGTRFDMDKLFELLGAGSRP